MKSQVHEHHKVKLDQQQSYQAKIKEFPPRFTDFFKGREYKVSKHLLYDADTINIVIPIEGIETTVLVRLLGYDAIEKKQKKNDLIKLTLEDQALLLDKYKQSESLITNLIQNKELRVKCQKMEKFGRLLADIYVQDGNGNEIHVNKAMIDSKLVFVYNGQTKFTIDEQIKFLKDTSHQPSLLHK